MDSLNPEPESAVPQSRSVTKILAEESKMTESVRAMRELRMMFRYATSAGLDIDKDTGLLIAAAMNEEPELSDSEVKSLARLIRQIQWPIDHDDESQALGSLVAATNKLSLIIAAHNALTKIIAPATPISLEATEPAPGWLGSIRRPPLVLAMIIIAIIAIIGFVTTSVISAPPQNKATEYKGLALCQLQAHDDACSISQFYYGFRSRNTILGSVA